MNVNAKKLGIIVLILSLLACSVFAGELRELSVLAPERKIGMLALLNTTEKEFQEESRRSINDTFFTVSERYGIIPVFYDSLTAMQMALNAGDVDEIVLPEAVAEYVMNVNDNYKIASIIRFLKEQPLMLAFGFRKDDEFTLRNKFNEALLSMKADGTLAVIKNKYIDEPGIGEPDPVKFTLYQNADKIRVAVTGDLPPIDFIAADGTPAGFNTAVLSELGKRLHVNIELVNIEANARAASLASKRVDAVFWMQVLKGETKQLDVPEGIALSEPYYEWDEQLFIKLKDKK